MQIIIARKNAIMGTKIISEKALEAFEKSFQKGKVIPILDRNGREIGFIDHIKYDKTKGELIGSGRFVQNLFTFSGTALESSGSEIKTLEIHNLFLNAATPTGKKE